MGSTEPKGHCYCCVFQLSTTAHRTHVFMAIASLLKTDTNAAVMPDTMEITAKTVVNNIVNVDISRELNCSAGILSYVAYLLFSKCFFVIKT